MMKTKFHCCSDIASFAASQRRQRGASLLFALSALVGLTLAGVAMMRTADTSTLVAGNVSFHAAAVQSTDLALEHAIVALQSMTGTAQHQDDASKNYFASLRSGADFARPPFEGNTLRLDAAPANDSDKRGTLVEDPLQTGTRNKMWYVIERMCNSSGSPSPASCVMDGVATIYRITTWVNGPRGTSEIVQHRLQVSQFNQNCALMTNSTLTTNGGALRVEGTGNCVYSNADVSWGASGVVGNIFAVGVAGTNNGGAFNNSDPRLLSNQPQLALPPIVPSRYRDYADYIFRADGTVQQKNWLTGTYSVVPSGLWPAGFSAPGTGAGANACAATFWCRGGSTPPPPGLYYFETNVRLAGSGDMTIAVIAERSIDASGSILYTNYKKNDPALVPQNVDNIFMLAGGDLNFGGGSGMTDIQGILAANEEVILPGSPVVYGSVLARNSNAIDPAGMANLGDANVMSGNARIIYNPNWNLSLWPMEIARRQWRTVER